MKNYLKNWNFMRVLRLVLGISIITQGIMAQQWILAILGGLFSIMPLINAGCCGTSSCNTTIRRSNKKTKDVSYEEVC